MDQPNLVSDIQSEINNFVMKYNIPPNTIIVERYALRNIGFELNYITNTHVFSILGLNVVEVPVLEKFIVCLI